jgi:hypothetical protein
MGLDKAIKYGKEKRKPYRKGKAAFGSCRNHGSCPWCTNNRLYSYKKGLEEIHDKIKDYLFNIEFKTEMKRKK